VFWWSWMEYLQRVVDIYRQLDAEEGVDDDDVADLAVAVLQEEAKDRRMEFIDERKDERVRQMSGRRSGGSSDDWREEPASEAQKELLDRHDVSYEEDITKGEASDLIDREVADRA